MRNLSAGLEVQRIDLDAPDAGEHEQVQVFCLGAGDGRVYCATDAAAIVCLAERGCQVAWRVPLLPPRPAGARAPAVAALCHVLELDALFIALASGELLLLHTATRALEEVGAIEGGVAAAAWSPDGEALAIAGPGGKLLLLSKDWEVLAETAIPFEAAPAAADGDAGTDADGAPPGGAGGGGGVRITWRGDGRYFATSSAPVAGGAWRAHVWDREGCALHAAAAAAPGLRAPACWQPNGRHLYVAAEAAPAEAAAAHEEIAGLFAAAAAARLRDAGRGVAPAPAAAAGSGAGAVAGGGVDAAAAAAAPQSVQRVVLYERNGLQHGGFDIPEVEGGRGGVIWDLIWSPDSELLAVVLGPRSGTDDGGGGGGDGWRVQIWHRSNWHWYLKLEIPFPGLPRHARLCGAWDEERPGMLHVVSSAGEYVRTALAWQGCVSARGTAAVIDGCDVLLTPFSRSTAPPPSCAARVRLPRPVCGVAFLDDDGSGAEALAALLPCGRLAFARAVDGDQWEETLEEQVLWARQQQQRQQQGGRGARQQGDAARPPPPARLAAPPPQHQTLRQRVSSAWDEVRALAPLGGALGAAAAAAPAPPAPPPAGGRRVKGLAWLAPGRLLLVAAPHADAGIEGGEGDVLVEVAVALPEPLLSAAEGEAPEPPAAPEVEEVATCYAGGPVLAAAAVPLLAGGGGGGGGAGGGDFGSGGGALLQLASGRLLRYAAGGGAPAPLVPAAGFPAPCALMQPLPPGAAPGGAAAAGLGAGGALYVGQRLVAGGVTSFSLRWGGAGGPAMLYTTRRDLLYTVMLSRLGAYVHKEPDAAAAAPPSPRLPAGDLKGAMCAAMRPGGAAAAAKEAHVRAVEQGARLVAAPAGGCRAVLQMPRGNLEAASPRLLVLAAALGALRGGAFREAWRIAAEQRLDLNLLVDDRWPAFLSEAPTLVEAIADPSDLCDLLFALKPTSVLAPGGLYAGIEAAAGLGAGAPAPASPATAPGGGGAAGGKVAAACVAVREAVLRLAGGGGDGAAVGGDGALRDPKYLKVICTSYARSDPPDLESALQQVRAAKEASLAAGCGAAVVAPPPPLDAAASDDEGDVDAVQLNGGGEPAAALGAAADAALRHLLLHAPPEALYRSALARYDLALAFMVVSHAQRDPGEYLEELARFGAITDENLRRHQIDLHLRRYPSALRHLAAAGPGHFDASLALAARHGLLRQLVEIARAQSVEAERGPGADPAAHTAAAARLAAAAAAHGEALRGARRFEDAGLALLVAGDPEAALAAYAEGGHWRPALALAGRAGWAKERQQQLARELAGALAGSGQGGDAARVMREYLGDADGAVAALVAAREWREALRAAYADGRPDLVDTCVAPGAAEAAAGLLSEAKEARDKVGRYLSRVRDVRGRRLALNAALLADGDGAGLAGGGGGHCDDGDAVSEAPSILSGFSIYTDATAAPPGGSAASGSGASAAPSTLGGRKAAPKRQKRPKPGRKIKAGSPEEERALREHLAGLGPPDHSLEEAGQITELLCVLGHAEDGRRLQQAVAAWQAEHAAAAGELAAMDAEDAAAAGGGQQQQHHQQQQQKQQKQAAAAAAGWKWDIFRAA
ncbi:MAG: IKI3 family-domain-containing protein [Monoraphidium minutum]|nr:MAG: IKI3 family-domain-containing protein [Monoraphidium minutum]